MAHITATSCAKRQYVKTYCPIFSDNLNVCFGSFAVHRNPSTRPSASRRKRSFKDGLTEQMNSFDEGRLPPMSGRSSARISTGSYRPKADSRRGRNNSFLGLESSDVQTRRNPQPVMTAKGPIWRIVAIPQSIYGAAFHRRETSVELQRSFSSGRELLTEISYN